MIWAWNETFTKAFQARPNVTRYCNICKAPLIPKCGRIKVWHFAHKSAQDCDTWAESETEWHTMWKSIVPEGHCEVAIEFDGKAHRVDALSDDGIAVEFQHSSISSEIIDERSQFYLKTTGGCIWIVDAAEFISRLIFPKKDIPDDLYGLEHGEDISFFRWVQPRKSWEDLINSKESKIRVFLDLGWRLLEMRNFNTLDVWGEWGEWKSWNTGELSEGYQSQTWCGYTEWKLHQVESYLFSGRKPL